MESLLAEMKGRDVTGASALEAAMQRHDHEKPWLHLEEGPELKAQMDYLNEQEYGMCMADIHNDDDTQYQLFPFEISELIGAEDE